MRGSVNILLILAGMLLCHAGCTACDAGLDPEPTEPPPPAPSIKLEMDHPIEGQTLGGRFPLTGSVRIGNSPSNEAVAKFFVDDVEIGTRQYVAPDYAVKITKEENLNRELYSWGFRAVVPVDSTAYADGNHVMGLAVENGEDLWTKSEAAVTIDNAKPEVSLTSPTEGTDIGQLFPLEATGSDGTSGVSLFLKVNGVTVRHFLERRISRRMAFPELPPGGHELSVVAVDAAGNRSTLTVFVLR